MAMVSIGSLDLLGLHLYGISPTPSGFLWEGYDEGNMDLLGRWMGYHKGKMDVPSSDIL